MLIFFFFNLFRYFIIYSKKEFIMGCYDSGYIYVRNRENYLEIPAYLLIEWEGENQSTNVMTSQQLRWVLFVVFIFNWIFCSGTSLFKIQKDSNFQIIFPIPCHIFITLVMIITYFLLVEDIKINCTRAFFCPSGVFKYSSIRVQLISWDKTTKFSWFSWQQASKVGNKISLKFVWEK